MFNVKIKRPDGSEDAFSYYGKWDAFTGAISFYQGAKDDWGIGYLHATRRYITAANLAAEPFTYFYRGFYIIVEDASNPAKPF